ncbi:hypothetical protein FI667_g7709, partial [Globisporangium splendens]
MVTLRKLLGARNEVHYECMYTKHKTQKRKVWYDGFLSLHASRKLVLYEDQPPEGKVLDEAKVSVYNWDRKDEEYINVTKFLIEVVNETPLNIQVGGGSAASSATSGFTMNAPQRADPYESSSSSTAAMPPPRPMNSKFKVSVSNGGGPLPAPRPGMRQPLRGGRSGSPSMAKPADIFDFSRNPTSEWTYTPHAINRSGANASRILDRHAERHHVHRIFQTHSLPLWARKRDVFPRVLGSHERLRVQHVVVLRDLLATCDLTVAAAASVALVELVERDAEQQHDEPRERVQHDLRRVHHDG